MHITPYRWRQSGYFAGANALLLSVWLLLAAGCANEVNPMGGPRDQTGPVMVKTVPENKSLYYQGTVVTFYFDEFIKPATYGKEVFISPLPATKPKITLNNKKLKVKFNEDLRPNTTYVITLNEIKDHFEGNSMKESYTFAFSTGGVLDSLEIRGRVLKPQLGQGQGEMTLMLFDADSVPGNDFYKKQPAYITKTSETGTFSFPFLRNSPFKIYGVIDKDQNNRYSQLTEVIAISDRPIVEFDSLIQAADSLRKLTAMTDSSGWDSMTVDSFRVNVPGIDSLAVDSLAPALPDTLKAQPVVADTIHSDSLAVDSLKKEPEAIFAFRVLYSFLPDDQPPTLQGYNWVNPNTVIAKFSEGILPDSLHLTVSDTLGNDLQPVSDYTFVPTKDMELLIHSPRIRDSLSSMFFQNLNDSLNNWVDTLLEVTPKRGRELKQALFVPPAYDFVQKQFRFVTSVLVGAADSVNIFVTDTARVKTPALVKAAQSVPVVPDSLGADTTQVVPDVLPAATDSLIAKSLPGRDSLFVPRRLPVRLERKAFRVGILPLETPKPKKTYLLNIKGELMYPLDSVLRDSVYTWPLIWPDKADYGTLSGSIRIDTAEYQGPIIAELINDKDAAIRTFFDTTFQFTMLPPGKYRFRITLDTDGNRSWTPGSLKPYRLPEKIYLHGASVDIRANWDFEEHLVEVQLKNAGEFAAPAEDKETAGGAAPGVPGKAGQSPGSSGNRPPDIEPGGK